MISYEPMLKGVFGGDAWLFRANSTIVCSVVHTEDVQAAQTDGWVPQYNCLWRCSYVIVCMSEYLYSRLPFS